MTGEGAALATAVLWTITAITFEYAANRIGSKALNFLRLAVGSLFLGAYGFAVHGSYAPFDASISTWLWLGASGIVGLVLGDLLLFQAFIDIGARLSMLVYALAPGFAAILGWFVFGERLEPLTFAGMALTMGGIAMAVLGRPEAPKAAEGAAKEGSSSAKAPPSIRAVGIAMAFLAALCQAGGLILSKIGAPTLDAFSGTQIRVLVGVLAFGFMLLVTRGFGGISPALKDKRALGSLVAGSFFGPFLGVSLSLAAIQGASAGVASSIMSITPVLIILPSVLIFREKVTVVEVVGAIVAVAGTALLFI
jgi:drug/metabolite transporter (DMT)-like permease